MAESKQEMRKPVFTKVDQLRPGTNGHTLTVKVVSSKLVMRLAECLVGDETAMIIFTARNEQVEKKKEGTTVTLRNAKVDMFRGSMRLGVDKWGVIDDTVKPAEFVVKEDNILSLIEFAVVDFVEG